MLDAAVAEFLRACVRARLSVVFAGAPGSGKTTLLSCCTAELDPGLRVVVAEEVFEADVPLPNVSWGICSAAVARSLGDGLIEERKLSFIEGSTSVRGLSLLSVGFYRVPSWFATRSPLRYSPALPVR